MKITELRIFHELVNNQLNVSRTAHNNNMAQSAVTRKIQSLEHSLGMPLVVRHGKKLVGLTDLGEQVLEQSRSILMQIKNLQTIAADSKSISTGSLRIATTNTQARFFLPTVITKFRGQFPEVSIHLYQGDPRQLIGYLYDGKVDVAICTEALMEDPNLRVQVCYNWNHVVIVPKGHPLADKKILTLDDIAEHPVLTYAFYLTGGGRIRQAFQQAGLVLNIVFSALDTEVIKTYVRLGQGVGIIANMAYNEQEDGDLVCKPIDHLVPDSSTKIAWLKEKYLSDFTKDFIQLGQEEGRKMFAPANPVINAV